MLYAFGQKNASDACTEKGMVIKMDWIFVLSSVTYALKAQQLLQEKQISSSLTRSASIRKVRNCGYGLRVRQADLARAEKILEDANIRILGTVRA